MPTHLVVTCVDKHCLERQRNVFWLSFRWPTAVAVLTTRVRFLGSMWGLVHVLLTLTLKVWQDHGTLLVSWVLMMTNVNLIAIHV